MCYWILPILIVISNLTSSLLTLNIHCIWSLAWFYYCMVYSPYYQRPKCSIYLLFTYGYLLFQLYMKLWSLVLVLKVFEPNFSWPNALPDANHQMLMHWAKAQCISLILSLIIIIQRQLVRRRNMAWVTTRAPINVKTTLLDAVRQFK